LNSVFFLFEIVFLCQNRRKSRDMWNSHMAEHMYLGAGNQCDDPFKPLPLLTGKWLLTNLL
jgi:hypothetical protein